MVTLGILDRLKNLSISDKVESEYPFFILYLRAVTSGVISRLLMLKAASEKSIFKHIGPYLNKILTLTTDWRYPQARASEILSEEVPLKDFGEFLYKFSQSISSGEPVSQFIEREHKNFMAEYEAVRMQSIDRLKTLSDAYLPMMSVTLFLTTTLLISSIFYDPEVMINLTILTVIVISFILYLISWLIFKSAKPDGILLEQDEKPSQRRRMELIALGSIALAVLSLLIPMQNSFQHIVVVGVLLLIPGALGKYYIHRIKKREEVYPGFLRFMGSNLSTDIPLMNVITEASETDFGVLNSPIKGLYNRLRMRVEPRIAWWSFETELDSQLIRRMNLILTDTVYTGGNLTEASKFLEDFSHIYTTIRRRRYAAASYHTGIMLPLYYVMAGMFATLDGFFSALEGFMSKISTMVPFLSPPPVGFMKFFFMFALVLFALNNVFSLYNIEGDSRFTIMFFMGLQLALGGIIYLTISTAVVGYLSGIAML